jgi:exosortase
MSADTLPVSAPFRWRFSLSQILALGLAASCLLAYWPTLMEMAERWAHEPQYSHGFLVPIFALFLLWHRRPSNSISYEGTPWGLVLVLVGAALHLTGTYFYVAWLEAVSLLPCLCGICFLLGGWRALRWAWPAIAFLIFMLPLPFFLERALVHPLKRIATLASTVTLEICGFRATSEGNIIWINDETRIGVVEACDGLSMLLTFFALATAFALVVKRPWFDRALLIVSAIPIALIANVARITLTAILQETAGNDAARVFFHDLAGWFMMLFALGILWLEVHVLSRLIIEPSEPARTTPTPINSPVPVASSR